jgi:hypothetical protein
MEAGTIFDFITSETTKYSKPVEIEEGWSWNMREHLKRSFLYLNSQFSEDNDNRTLRPFKNIILPILNIQFRTEGFDVKDIELYVDNPDEYFKSLLVRKYHTTWALAESIDSFIDEMVESYGSYGGALIRKTKKAKPEVVDLRTLAFANQHSILDNPFGILHEMSFSELRDKAEQYGWGDEGSDIDIEGLIQLAKKEGKDCVKVYEVHGNLPIEWLKDEDIVGISKKDVGQIQVVAEYRNQDGKKAGVTLFRKKMPKLPFKFIKRDDVKNRALGRGGVEELFEAQTWTNWDEVKIREMLDSASKTIHWSDDPSFKSRNNLNGVDNNEVLSLMEGRQIQQLNTYPRNLQVFNESVDRFWQNAQMVGAAPEALMGEEPSSGTPFKLYEAQQIEGKGLHKYRQGKLATFMDELYRDWILPFFQTEIVKEQTFMEELSADEMAMVVEKVMTKKVNAFKKQMIMGMQDIDDDIVSLYANKVREDVMKQGSKRFFQILKDEMKDLPIKVMTNIAGKQKNLALLTDKLVNVLRQYISTPQIRQDPEMGKIMNVILESSGLNPMNILPMPQQPMAQPQQGGQAQGGMMPQEGQAQ